jgi:hypothetical protein
MKAREPLNELDTSFV